MRALFAATCLSIMAAIGYYFWSEHQAWQEHERNRIEIAAQKLEASQMLEKQIIENRQREERIAQEQKKQAEEEVLNKITRICEINLRNVEDYLRRSAARGNREKNAEEKMEEEALIKTTERCAEHYKMRVQRESETFIRRLEEMIINPN